MTVMKLMSGVIAATLAVVLMATGCTTTKKKKEEYTHVRIYVQTVATLPEGYRFKIDFPHPNIWFWVNSIPELTEDDLIGAETVPGDAGLQIKLKFNHHGEFVLEGLTGSNRGKYMAVIAARAGIARAIAPILIKGINRSGELIFTPDLTDEETTKIVSDLNKVATTIRSNDTWGMSKP